MTIITLPTENTLNEEFIYELNKLKSSKCFITTTKLAKEILLQKLPIQNKRIATKNILSFLTWLDIQIHKSGGTIIPIHTDTLIEYFNINRYKSYMDLLKKLEILTDVPYEDGAFYDKGARSKQYRVHNQYLQDRDLCIVIFEKESSVRDFVCNLDLDVRYIKTIRSVELNIKNAILDEINYCNREGLDANNLRTRISRIFYTGQKRFIKKGNIVNRIYHSFSNLSKVARKHFDIRFHNIDIRNSQPLFLVAYLDKQGLDYDLQYKLDCEGGNFYEQFSSLYSDRDDLKRAVFKRIFFGFDEDSAVNKLFKKIYPKTWENLKNFSLTEETLASRLQNLEADLFNKIRPRKSNNYFTLFDSIYFNSIDDVDYIKDEIMTFFDELNIKVKLNIEL